MSSTDNRPRRGRPCRAETRALRRVEVRLTESEYRKLTQLAAMFYQGCRADALRECFLGVIGDGQGWED